MDFIAKYILRAAGFCVAAQIFLTMALIGDDLGGKLVSAGKYAMMAIPMLVIGGFLASEDRLRHVGFTIRLWAGAGLTLFLGSVYGDPMKDRIPFVTVPEASQVSLAFGLVNFAVVMLLGFLIWVSGLKMEPAPAAYHDLRPAR